MELKDLYKHLDLLSEYDNKPVKSRLTSELKEKFLTEKQWLEKGFKPKENAFVYEMHPSSLNKKLCSYFYIDDVELCFQNVVLSVFTTRIVIVHLWLIMFQ